MNILGFYQQIRWGYYAEGFLVAELECGACKVPYIYKASAYPISLCEQDECAEEHCKACYDILVTNSNEID